jgi:hypothetical protein
MVEVQSGELLIHRKLPTPPSKAQQDFLDGWQGHLVVDDYAGYKSLFTLAGNCTELGCWAHARRKFFDLHQASASTVAFEALQRIGKLYAVEDEGKHLTIETRQQLRTEKSLSILQSLHDWLLQTRAQIADGGGTAKAIDYTLKRWQSLIRNAGTGYLPIDNTRRKHDSTHRTRQEKLVVRRFRTRRKARLLHSNPARHCKTQRT